MREIDVLTKNVIRGLNAHQIIGFGSCDTCPYRGRSECAASLMSDAITVIDYWKGKYENTVLQQPMMILSDPMPVKIEPVDIRSTLKAIKSMKELEKLAKRAAQATTEATEAILALKEEVNKVESE